MRPSLDLETLPYEILPYLSGASIRECSFGERFSVYFIEQGPGYYLKIGAPFSLVDQGKMANFWAEHGLGPRAQLFQTAQSDFLLMQALKGESGISTFCLAQPKKLVQAVGKALRQLHDVPLASCPVQDAGQTMLELALQTAQAVANTSRAQSLFALQSLFLPDAAIHGDACLPNILLNPDFSLSGFIDFECGGVGDRHYDLSCALWSIEYNLKTHEYANDFLDAYGRDVIDLTRLGLAELIRVFT